MNPVEFENDSSIIFKAYNNLTIKRSKKEIKLILIYHSSYYVIEIKIFDNSANMFIGREVLDYSDIYLLFNNYFICLNENMEKIFFFINNCINLKKYDININENSKTINIELFILKDNNIDAKIINIPCCDDENKCQLISKKIKEFNDHINKEKRSIVAPFLNYINYENNTYNLFMNIYIEKEIEILVFKAKLVYKNVINKEEYFAGFYSRDDINNICKYYESISNLDEISDDIKLNLANKNLKIENVTEGKIKIALSVLSSVNQKIIIFDLVKDADIKEKYIQIINELRMKNKFLANNDIFLNNNISFPLQKNNDKINNNDSMSNISNKNTSDESNDEKNTIGKKRKRLMPIKMPKTTKNDVNKEQQDNDDNSNFPINANNIKNCKRKKKNLPKTQDKKNSRKKK